MPNSVALPFSSWALFSPFRLLLLQLLKRFNDLDRWHFDPYVLTFLDRS
jgi:hypothetical protein